MASSSNSPCAACKFLRRKCTSECLFAPYFPPDKSEKFASVHKVFGRSNVAKILSELPLSHRQDAVNSLIFEAESRISDPLYGCIRMIFVLQQKLKDINHDLHNARTELATYIGPSSGCAIPGVAPAAMAPFGVSSHQSQWEQVQHHHQQQQQLQQEFGTYNGGFGEMGIISSDHIGINQLGLALQSAPLAMDGTFLVPQMHQEQHARLQQFPEEQRLRSLEEGSKDSSTFRAESSSL